MKAVILAAGKSTRTYPLTVNKPKSMLKVLDKTILEHILDQLVDIVDEVMIIVGFKKNMIIDKFGASYKGIKIFYAEQKEQLGTGHALQIAKPFLEDKFLVLNGDDIFFKEDIQNLTKFDYGMIAKEVDDIRPFGALITEDDKVTALVEKPKEQISNLANIGLYIFKKDIFDIDIKPTSRGEIELTCYIDNLAKQGEMHFSKLSKPWYPIAYPWNYLEANVKLLNSIKESNIDSSVIIENNVTIKGIVHIGKNSIIKSGTYIEGPVFIGENCEVGPNAFLRKDTILQNGVRTRAEIIDSVLMEKTTAKHDCYIGHSVFGENCNIAAGTITSDYRHDAQIHFTVLNGKKIDTKRKKLGAFLGDNVMTGIGTKFYPGRKVWPGLTTLPGEIVEKDIVSKKD